MSETLARVIPYAVDLGKTVKKTYLDTLFATDDSEAHRFDIILYRDNAKLTIPSGASVSAYFIRYGDDVTIPLSGSADGNVVSVTLTKYCYNKAGQFALIIKVTTGSEISTVFYGEGAIFTSSTDSILDDEHIIPSLADLLAQIDAMESATAAANTAISNANTATTNANEAAGKANTAADTANTAADNANEATGNANTAADTANAAAGKIDSMTVTATTLETGSPATATLTTVDGHYQLNLGLPKGNTGDTGATPQISVQVETGAAGSEAQVSVSGTAEEPVIHLTIPRGDTGAIENMTINGKPVESGTITLTAEDLGASTAEEVSQLKNDKLDKTATAADSSKLGGKTIAEIMLALYPVGAVYISANSTSPASLFGGTWESIGGRFLLGADATYAAGSTDGEATHTLTRNELPIITGSIAMRASESQYNTIITADGVFNTALESNVSSTLALNGSGNLSRLNMSFGGNEAHNNMPPYLAVYMWKRVS